MDDPLRAGHALESWARARSRALGHWLTPFDRLADGHASAECRNAGCNLGVTIDTDRPASLRVSGAAVVFHCPGRALDADKT